MYDVPLSPRPLCVPLPCAPPLNPSPPPPSPTHFLLPTPSQVPILATLVDLPLVSSLLQGFLPSLVLLLFLAAAPYLLQALIHRAGLASMTAIDSQLIGMYFLFQLFAVFIFSFISGTALSQLQGLIDDPHR